PSQQIIITGSGFGKRAPYVGNSESISLSTSTGWNAGSTKDAGGDLVTLAIRSWKDDEIVLDGFRGAYGQHNWKISSGDKITFQIWNAATSADPGGLTVSVT